jgi:hypothetical protein
VLEIFAVELYRKVGNEKRKTMTIHLISKIVKHFKNQFKFWGMQETLRTFSVSGKKISSLVYS